jgi:hypothetical protein
MEQSRKSNRSTIMRACTEQTFDIRPLADIETNEVSGGLPSVALVFGPIGVAAGDLRGHVMNGVAKAALEVLLGK